VKTLHSPSTVLHQDSLLDLSGLGVWHTGFESTKYIQLYELLQHEDSHA
jgi:hypothetical protein